ncbi:MAG: G5 domain-containing protein, partial [Deltaproteobacteria bacterium]|nr:G5 domain-containing protein [Deltaproteobacteria bacterium]
ISVAKGTTVQQALLSANIELGSLDRVEPPLTSVVPSESQIKVIRIIEEFDVEESVLPFQNQTVKNESMPDGKTVLIQPGVNGKISTTYRVLKEDGVILSRTIVKSDTIEESKPEIVMIGVQSPFVSLPIEGKLAYITSSSAWVMENNTGNRRPLVTSGDLDGRIFSISPDRNWLLFSRLPDASATNPYINSLWVVNLQTPNPEPISLGISNVVHFADWVPGKTRTIAFSTVEPRDIPPGWQANNDLKTLEFDEAGNVINQETIVDVNSGGIYGWWGTSFLFSPDGTNIAYARPDSLGLVNNTTGELEPKVSLTPYQTGGDWAWVPSLTWSPDGKILFSVLHGPANTTKIDETSTQFDMAAILIESGTIIRLYPNAGMFATAKPSTVKSDSTYLLGILTSILPAQSETSKYDLRIMDRDGSNIQKLYPGEGIQGLNPQQITWSPQSQNNGMTLGFLSQGNIMLVDISSDSISQVSGDGTVSKIDWK